MTNTPERTPRLSRRGVLRAGSGLLGTSLAPSVFPAPAWAQGTPAAAGAMTVTLLGTGSPSPNPVRFSAALMDDIVPPSTVFAAYNAYAGPKEVQVWPYNGHEAGGADDDQAALAFLLSHLCPAGA